MADEQTNPGTSTLQVEGALEAVSNIIANEQTEVKIESLEEGEIPEGEPDVAATLAADSTTPLPLLKDSTQQISPSDLSNQLYANLEERHLNLVGQHKEQQKLNRAYEEIIHGASSFETSAISVEQLRREAGPEGLRAKALVANVLDSIMRDAGGPQALVSQTLLTQSLIEQIGSFDDLKEAVMDAQMLRLRVNEVGGLQGLDHLVQEVRSLRSEQDELKATVEGADGLRAKATKYNSMKQAFAAIDNGSALGFAEETSATMAPKQITSVTAFGVSNTTAMEDTGPMNPARVRMIKSEPDGEDLNEHVHEPTHPDLSPWEKTGSNHVPLGPRRPNKRSTDQGYPDAWKRQKLQDERERTGFGTAPFNFGRPTAAPSQSFSWSDEHGHFSVTATVGTNGNLIGPSTRSRTPVAKTEGMGDSLYTSTSYGGLPTLIQKNTDFAQSLLGGYPMALWIEGGGPTVFDTKRLIKADGIPANLEHYLFNRMKTFLASSKANTWGTMAANTSTCVLGYMVNGKKVMGLPTLLRACKWCSSTPHRPCALLMSVDGVDTVVFMPLQDAHRRNIGWKDTRFWTMHK